MIVLEVFAAASVVVTVALLSLPVLGAVGLLCACLAARRDEPPDPIVEGRTSISTLGEDRFDLALRQIRNLPEVNK